MSQTSAQLFFSTSMIRDLQAATDVQKMNELGKFEQEITVYGTVCWTGTERKYLVSSFADKIYRYLYDEKNLRYFPVPVKKYTVRRIVPSGCENEIKEEVKLQLARELRDTYSEQYFRMCVTQMTKRETFYDNIIWNWLADIEDCFDEEKLYVFSLLLEKCRSKNCVSEQMYYRCQTKMQHLQQQMELDIKESYAQKKTMYGCCMIDGNGKLQYKTDGNLETIYRQMDAAVMAGHLVSPVYEKKYGIAYDKSLIELKAQFKQCLQEVFNEAYMALWEMICQKEVFLQKELAFMSEAERQSWVWIKNRYEYSKA